MIHFGLLTAILDGWSFEEAVDTAAEMGFECLEVACWPAGKAERRYAGVSHIDAERVLADDEYAEYVKKYIADKGMHISSLAYYPNTMDPDLQKRSTAIEHLKALIKASAKLGVGMVTTFIELFSIPAAKRKRIPDPKNDLNFTHFALEVSDLRAFRDHVIHSGGAAYLDTEISKGVDNTWQMWMHDPDGNRFEVMEYTLQSYQITGR